MSQRACLLTYSTCKIRLAASYKTCDEQIFSSADKTAIGDSHQLFPGEITCGGAGDVFYEGLDTKLGGFQQTCRPLVITRSHLCLDHLVDGTLKTWAHLQGQFQHIARSFRHTIESKRSESVGEHVIFHSSSPFRR